MNNENNFPKKRLSILKIFLVSAVAIAGVICMAQMKSPCSCSGKSCALTLASAKSNETPIRTNEKQEVKLPRMIDLGAKKCIPCKMMAPILEELEKEYDGILIVKFIDVWLPENAVEAEKYKIETIPTQIFFDKDGKELWRHEGFISKEDILKQWKSLGYDFQEIKKNFKGTGTDKNSEIKTGNT